MDVSEGETTRRLLFIGSDAQASHIASALGQGYKIVRCDTVDEAETLLQKFPSAKEGVLFDASGAHSAGHARTDQQRVVDRLKHLSITDDLTGLYNVRFLWARFRYEFLRARRYEQPLSCLFLDLDRFKRVNDQYGHRAGDKVLRHVAEQISKSIREVDIVARYGGEEFVVLLPNTDLAGARQCAEAIRKNIADQAIKIGDTTIRTRLSVGVSMLTEDVANEDELLKRADTALLRAKKQGRNRVCVWASDISGDPSF